MDFVRSGASGDYESLYVWLDQHKAKECGDSVAVISYRYKGELSDHLKEDLRKSIAIDKRTRIYVIWREPKNNSVKGKFIFGGRRAPTWAGYASSDAGTTDEEP
jgi:hypothetical protein